MSLLRSILTPSLESVDLLLKEMNQDPSKLTHDITQSSMSLSNSPTKPLNFPNPHNSQGEKEFNSSSDTYTSDAELDQNLIPSSFKKDTVESNVDLLSKNFETDDGKATIMINDSEFSFVGVASPERYQQDHIITNLEETYVNTSPSKSIMKKVPSMSPKKNVAFTSSNPEVHHYTFETSKTYSSEDDFESGDHSKQLLAHQWNELEKMSASSSDNESSTPPVPPPHNITNTFQKIFDDKAQLNDTHVDQQTLNELKLNHKKFSNLPLNEKLDIYLSAQDKDQDLNTKTPEELDEHLTNLQNSMKDQTDSHIHDLSLHLQHHNTVENPLDLLAKSSEVELRSSGSSQSSLQSLGENNRALYSEYDSVSGNQGITLNDGIKGFPDHMVQDLIPSTKEEGYLFIGAPLKHESESEDDVYHDSFDQSYNNTEMSIMNLLNSSSNLNLLDKKEENTNEQVSIKSEPQEPAQLPSSSHIKAEPESDTPFIKPEPKETIEYEPEVSTDPIGQKSVEVKPEPTEEFTFQGDEPVQVKQEPQDESIEIKTQNGDSFDLVYMKSEPLEAFEATDSFQNMFDNMGSGSVDNSKNDDSNDFDASEYAVEKIESASYILSLDARDVKLVQPKPEPESSVIDKSVPSPETDNQVKDRTSMEKAQENSETLVNKSEVNAEVVEKAQAYDISASSNDGDQEDNDITEHELSTIHTHARQQELTTTPFSEKQLEVAEDNENDENASVNVSDEFVGRSLAPPRVDEAIDATEVPSPIKRALLEKRAVATKERAKDPESSKGDISIEDQSILANSSNIAPQPGAILAVPDTNASFDDYSRQFDNKDSFEESLSAEHEADSKLIDFISIWHSQERKKKLYENHSDKQVPTYCHYESSDNKKYQIPSSLQPKVFKEVNVMSRRVVSPGHEDFNVSGFLPELSQDSGFGKQFNGLVKNGDTTMNLSNYSNVSGNRRSMTPLSTKNVLSNIDNDPSIIEPPAPKPISKRHTLAPDYASKYRQQHGEGSEVKVKHKQSKFKVPSFEIKRSNSVLSPRNQYNDIFEITEAPTIKSQGMKTLPSMDGDDVKKILEAKRGISQEEYSRVKLKANEKKRMVVLESTDQYDSLQQQASIHSTGDSTPIKREAHIRSELMKNPTALLTKEKLFDDSSIYLDDSQHPVASNPNNSDISGLSSILNESYKQTKNIESIGFPEPDPEFVRSPEKDNYSNIFKTPPSEMRNTESNDAVDKVTSDAETAADLALKYKIANSPRRPVQGPKLDGTPKKNGAPIKIGSPIKLLKQGTSVTGVTLDTSPVKAKQGSLKQDSDIKTPVSSSNPFRADELINAKIRDNSKIQPNEEERMPSTVSVPSNHTTATQPTLSSSATLNPDTSHFRQELRPQASGRNLSVSLPERGKLFFRVVGFKNIELSDLRNRGAQFSISLDNGVHCIKTPGYKLDNNNISIGKEFELTVADSLEFILTMKISYEKPRGKLVEVRERKVVKSRNRFSRMFGSKDIISTTRFVPQEIEDAWANKFAQDGSFARCYIDLDQYETQITGKAANFNLTCFNEWESVFDKSKNQVVKLKPYRIGQLEVKMLFVPRTDAHEVLPSSIKSAQESIGDLLQEANFNYEGYLHQEGGDCEIWKRRFFKLHGTSLIAHSEYSHKTRAKINLAKVVEIIYVDKENLQRSPQNYRDFSDILLVEHAFKIKFANGEIIDFGAPNKKEKDEWISIIEKIVYRNKFRRQPWVKLMIENQYNTALNRTNGNDAAF